MIPLSLETIITPLKNYEKEWPILQKAKDYFEKAYLVHAIEKNVWTKDTNGQPFPHGGIYIDGLAKKIGTSRKNASYLVNQKYELKSLIDFYNCEKKGEEPKNNDDLIKYKIIDKLLREAYSICKAYVKNDLQKYTLAELRKEELAHEIATSYINDIVKDSPKAAKKDFIVNRVLEQNLSLAEAKKEFEKHCIAAQWQEHHFSLDETAKKLGLSSRHLRRKINEHGLTPEQQFYFPLTFLWNKKPVTPTLHTHSLDHVNT